MDAVVVYTPVSSPRLEYILDWLLKERLQLKYRIVYTSAEAAKHRYVLSYGEILDGAINIPSDGLLMNKGIRTSKPTTGTWHSLPTLYPTDKKGYSLPFDILAATFYLLTRYEEYEAYTPDKHGRFPATASILYKMGILQRPIADEWIHALQQVLQRHWQLTLPQMRFSYHPTYDIDMAYSHLYKGIRRIAGAYLRAFLRVDIKQINARTQVLKKRQKDPYDSFRWMRQLHKEYGFTPLYFILSATRTTRFDKNIHPSHPAMVRVIKGLVKDGNIGIHPSYYSAKGDTLQREKTVLEQVAGKHTTLSRQHYIRAIMPHTYRMLLHNHITEDFTMGYGSHLGFRAGTGSSFPWYDLEQEATTTLRIHPFCFMDTTAHYEMGLSPMQAFERLQAMCALLEHTGSTLITVFHNFSLGTDDEWKGWRQGYELFMRKHSLKR